MGVTNSLFGIQRADASGTIGAPQAWGVIALMLCGGSPSGATGCTGRNDNTACSYQSQIGMAMRNGGDATMRTRPVPDPS